MDKAAGDRSKLHLQQWLGFRMQFEKSKKSVKPNRPSDKNMVPGLLTSKPGSPASKPRKRNK